MLRRMAKVDPPAGSGFSERCVRIAGSKRFQLTIFGVIVLNAIVLGLDTYDSVDERWGDTLFLLNEIFLGIFIVEILIRLSAYGSRPQDYFKDRWDVQMLSRIEDGYEKPRKYLRCVR